MLRQHRPGAKIKEEADWVLASEQSWWNADQAILQTALDTTHKKADQSKKFHMKILQQNKVDLAEVKKLFKESTKHDYNQGYLDGYASQDYCGRWDSSRLLAEIREVGLPLFSSLAIEAVKLVISEGSKSSSKFEGLLKEVIQLILMLLMLTLLQ